MAFVENKKISVLISSAFLASAIVIAGTFATGAGAASFKRIKSADEFNSKIVGKTLTAGTNAIVLQADGKMSGKIRGAKIVGSWNWQKGLFCRALKAGSQDFPSDCQVVNFNGSEVQFVPDQGKGEAGPLFKVN